MFRLVERDHVFTCLTEELPRSFSVALLHLGFCWFGLVRNDIPITKSQRSRGGIPSMRESASREMISASVELETGVCFLHIHFVGTNVWPPKMHRISPDVDFESSRSLAKSES